MKKASITVNVMNELAQIRKGVVFQSAGTVIDELLQNCQRAKATDVNISIEGDLLVMLDNGIGCDDLTKLFEKNSSGWGIAEAFGQGFFSTFSIADRIIVYSKDKMVDIDVLKVIEEGDLSYTVQYSGGHVDGMKVKLIGQKIEEFADQLSDRVATIGCYLEQDITLNGKKLEKKDLLEKQWWMDFSMVFDNEVYKAILSPNNRWADLELFYDNRPVMKDWYKTLQGNIMFKPDAVTLKAPDRQSLIKDKKEARYYNQLQKDAETLYKEFIQQAGQELIDDYAERISEVLTVDDYIGLLDFTDDLLDVKKLISSDEKLEVNKLPEELASKIIASAQRKEEDRKNISELSSDIGSIKVNARKLKDIKLDVSKTAYVLASEANDDRERIAEVEYYGYRIIVAKNKLYENAYRSLGLKHISEFVGDMEKENVIENVGLDTNKEKRIMFLLEKIERAFAIPDTFRIADLSLEVVTKVFDEEVSRERIGVDGLCTEGKIYLNRESLKLKMFRVDKVDNEYLTINDYRQLLRMSNTVAHEMSHLLYGNADNTKQHYECIERLQNDIAEIFS